MTAKLLAEHAGARAYLATWVDLARVVEAEGGCDALIVDAPYSDRTHGGHDAGADIGDRAADYSARIDPTSPDARHKKKYLAKSKGRRPLGYAAWSPDDVARFVAAWVPLTRGWFVSLTDHVLAPAWAAALEAAGRYVFSPLACVEPGSRVRMAGDGPAQWSCWAVVARPRRAPYSKWGALPGAYVVQPGHGERAATLAGRVVGGKPLALMTDIVKDYSRPGDIVADPCLGGGTTGVACLRLGRRFVGGDALKGHAEMGAERLRAEASLSTVADASRGQAPLFAVGGAP
jgi:hypothetical protein